MLATPLTMNGNKFGKWRVNLTLAEEYSSGLAEQLDLFNCPLSMEHIARLSDKACYRPKSYRYQDSPELKALIAERRQATGVRARQLGQAIVKARSIAKKAWLTSILEKGAAGDFHAISFFKRRQSTKATHGGYIMRAGGPHKAVSDLKQFYARKYTPPDPRPAGFALSLYTSSVGEVPNAEPFQVEEVQRILDTTKAGKSSGADGIPYELMHSILQSPLQCKFVAFFNSILHGGMPLPRSWLVSQVVFLPKVKLPAAPKDLRPIVLSSTPGKLFSKLLLFRLRSIFPPMLSGQLSGLPGAQSLDGSMALQHVIRQSQQWGLSLYAAKLDIAQAFRYLTA